MGQSFIDKIQAKFELWRLEQRYTRRRHRRSTFVSNAIYVDGEYVYQTPNSTGSSSDASHNQTVRIDALHGKEPVLTFGTETTAMSATERKRLHRFSSIPGFGRRSDPANDLPRVEERRASMIR